MKINWTEAALLWLAYNGALDRDSVLEVGSDAIYGLPDGLWAGIRNVDEPEGSGWGANNLEEAILPLIAMLSERVELVEVEDAVATFLEDHYDFRGHPLDVIDGLQELSDANPLMLAKILDEGIE